MTSKSLIRSIDPEVLSRAAEIIKLLGHHHRLRIVEALEEGEATVSEVQDALDLPQAVVSQHLSRLRGAGVVSGRREGVNVYYQITEPKVYHILECIRTCDM
ncbi:MAG: winged helix-turn-helix transcriptional regulator [Gemmatimonadetes bacterium]|nr:winged helix-turn-helix transcriptional regulator [Gemmatimonadota bacterium]